MPDQPARVDDNAAAAIIGVDENGFTIPLYVDPITGRLLIEITLSTETLPSSVPNTMPRDANRVPVWGAVQDDDGTTIVPIFFDSQDGMLWMDVLAES